MLLLGSAAVLPGTKAGPGGLAQGGLAPPSHGFSTPAGFSKSELQGGMAPHDRPSPTGLLVDFKPSPAVGVSASPSFAWVVPHLTLDHLQQPGSSAEAAAAVCLG